jgi:acetyltransferase-like isoleucine patch superfamily enzyme
MNNSDISSPIVIGNNVWIGRNCLIMPGTVIEDGVVIGANSLVKGTLKKDTIYAGNPVQEIRQRNKLV